MNPFRGSAVKEKEAPPAPNKTTIILDAINSKLGDKMTKCPICGDKAEWRIEKDIVMVRNVRLSEPVEYGEGAYSMAVVVCAHCGYTFFVNLVVLGVAEELGLEVPDA